MIWLRFLHLWIWNWYCRWCKLVSKPHLQLMMLCTSLNRGLKVELLGALSYTVIRSLSITLNSKDFNWCYNHQDKVSWWDLVAILQLGKITEAVDSNLQWKNWCIHPYCILRGGVLKFILVSQPLQIELVAVFHVFEFGDVDESSLDVYSHQYFIAGAMATIHKCFMLRRLEALINLIGMFAFGMKALLELLGKQK